MTVPDAPVNVRRDPSTTTISQVGILWDDGASDGGQAIIDYRVSFDQGVSSYIIVGSGLTVREFTKEALVQGQTYNFRVQARNAVGYSDLSDIASVICAVGPAKPGQPSTAVIVNDVIISWTEPVTDNGSPLTGYKVFI